MAARNLGSVEVCKFGREISELPAARARTPAPQCGTGVLARQISGNGLEIGQTPRGNQPTDRRRYASYLGLGALATPFEHEYPGKAGLFWVRQ
jgi:hypothetical protein